MSTRLACHPCVVCQFVSVNVTRVHSWRDPTLVKCASLPLSVCLLYSLAPFMTQFPPVFCALSRATHLSMCQHHKLKCHRELTAKLVADLRTWKLLLYREPRFTYWRDGTGCTQGACLDSHAACGQLANGWHLSGWCPHHCKIPTARTQRHFHLTFIWRI